MGRFRGFVWIVGGITAVSLIMLYLLTGTAVSYAQDVEEPTATPDRLAQPPTVAAPTQADEGEQLFWLHCQPCHGDVGQGFTEAEDDDWRAQYPPEDKYCWESGCHGQLPYEEGFTIPTRVPAVMGEGTLERFYSAAQLHAYIKGTMPQQWPGILQDDEYLQLTAFLARSHDVEIGSTLTVTNLSEFVMNPELIVLPENTAVPETTSTITETETTNTSESTYNIYLVGLFVAGVVLGFVIIGGVVWLRRNR